MAFSYDWTGLPYIRLIPKVTAVSGEVLHLKCPVAGYPIEEIHWERGMYLSYLLYVEFKIHLKFELEFIFIFVFMGFRFKLLKHFLFSNVQTLKYPLNDTIANKTTTLIDTRLQMQSELRSSSCKRHHNK